MVNPPLTHAELLIFRRISLLEMEFEEKRVRSLEIVGREGCERIPCNTRIQIYHKQEKVTW
jgi:hypothetical protein